MKVNPVFVQKQKYDAEIRTAVMDEIGMKDEPVWAISWIWVGFVLGMILAYSIWFNTPGINCPREDMCAADYYNGQWHIVRVDP